MTKLNEVSSTADDVRFCLIESHYLVFDVYDEDYDGLISTSHLGSLMRVVGLFPTEKDIVSVVKEIDRENSGFINLGAVYVLIARSFRDIGETETSTKNSLRKLSYDQLTTKAVSPTNKDKRKNKKDSKSTKPVAQTESLRLISLQSIQNAATDNCGEPLSAAQSEEFVKNLPKRLQSPYGDLVYSQLEAYILSDVPAVDGATSHT